MARIGFIGLGNMGGPMAANLVAGGNDVVGYDVAEAAVAGLAAKGLKRAETVAAAADGVDFVITMLPAGEHVEQVFTTPGGILESARPGTVMIDCSTIDVATARRVANAARSAGFGFADAPVSGGVSGAEGGTLTFMVGGDTTVVDRAKPLLEQMGRNVVHCGAAGAGQAAKICNNLILGVSMIAVSEAFALADRLGLDRQILYNVASSSSGQCWSLTTYCPVPGPVATSPANRGYVPGFSAAMMLKDLALAREAAVASGANTPLGGHAAELYERYCDDGGSAKDFSGIFTYLSDRAKPD